MLDEGRIEDLLRSLRSIWAKMSDPSKGVRIEAGCINGHADRMRYTEFRQQDPFLDSGVIETGYRTMFGRLKRSRMFGTVDGANVIITLRCRQLADLFEDYSAERVVKNVSQNAPHPIFIRSSQARTRGRNLVLFN